MVDDVRSEDTADADDKKGRSGRGKSGGGGGIRISPDKLKTVMATWEHLDLAKVVARVAEFFSELPARASANAVVNWGSMNRHGFAVVNHLISSGQEISHFMRERTAGHIKRLRTKYGVKITAAAAAGNPANPNFSPNLG